MISTVIFFLCLIASSRTIENNVCKNLEDYETYENNKNCWYNPDVDEINPKKIALRYGYPFESYKIKTLDGYLLTLFRIPHFGTQTNETLIPILLQHGLLADGVGWFTAGSQSMAFFFANNGYDVWISNSRGTKYSQGHVSYTVNDKQFWDFSFHEMAVYDIPAMIEFIVSKTGQRGEIIYVGHSMGTTISYIYSSLKPKEAESNLKAIISLGPVAFLDHITPIMKVIAQIGIGIDFYDILETIGIYGSNSIVKLFLEVYNRLCSTPSYIKICRDIFDIVNGDNLDEFVASEFPVFISHWPSGVSLKTFVHFGQIINSKRRFPFYDYGKQINLKLYESEIPPEYPLEQIKVPIHLNYGKKDPLAVEEDVFYLFKRLNTEKTIFQAFNFTHFNFFAAKHSPEFFEILLKYIEN